MDDYSGTAGQIEVRGSPDDRGVVENEEAAAARGLASRERIQ
jgi:hypothetical protein